MSSTTAVKTKPATVRQPRPRRDRLVAYVSFIRLMRKPRKDWEALTRVGGIVKGHRTVAVRTCNYRTQTLTVETLVQDARSATGTSATRFLATIREDLDSDGNVISSHPVRNPLPPQSDTGFDYEKFGRDIKAMTLALALKNLAPTRTASRTYNYIIRALAEDLDMRRPSDATCIEVRKHLRVSESS
ncbi:hypothetical protein [Nocardia suismassiliense]|uniref:hypothetical protein n=1 Tax=Nocardia suismassiliense TaxID=2077092 RepID=UPI000D1E5681|nr:hypothetical protein [Nocardia suismassiliense]